MTTNGKNALEKLSFDVIINMEESRTECRHGNASNAFEYSIAKANGIKCPHFTSQFHPNARVSFDTNQIYYERR